MLDISQFFQKDAEGNLYLSSPFSFNYDEDEKLVVDILSYAAKQNKVIYFIDQNPQITSYLPFLKVIGNNGITAPKTMLSQISSENLLHLSKRFVKDNFDEFCENLKDLKRVSELLDYCTDYDIICLQGRYFIKYNNDNYPFAIEYGLGTGDNQLPINNIVYVQLQMQESSFPMTIGYGGCQYRLIKELSDKDNIIYAPIKLASHEESPCMDYGSENDNPWTLRKFYDNNSHPQNELFDYLLDANPHVFDACDYRIPDETMISYVSSLADDVIYSKKDGTVESLNGNGIGSVCWLLIVPRTCEREFNRIFQD